MRSRRRSCGSGSTAPARTRLRFESIERGERTDLSPLEQARRIAGLAQEKLARDVVILDMRPVCTYTDYFVVASGQNPRQAKAIFDEVVGRMKREARLIPRSVEGAQQGEWIVADYLDVVLHVFTPDTRAYYRLEDLWGDVPHESVDGDAARPAEPASGVA